MSDGRGRGPALLMIYGPLCEQISLRYAFTDYSGPPHSIYNGIEGEPQEHFIIGWHLTLACTS